MGNATRKSGFTMAAGTFIAVSSTGTFTLGDLSVTGYASPVWDEEQEQPQDGTGIMGGDFVVQVLNSSGGASARYYWIDDADPSGKGKGWYVDGGGETKADTTTEFDIGTSFWIYGSGYTLTSAGAVNENDIQFATRGSGFTAAGNATPVDLTLGKILVKGYADPVWDENQEQPTEGTGVMGGDFVVQVLNQSGGASARYYWIDDGDPSGKGKGWYVDGGGETKADTTTEISAGQGLWIYGSGYNLYVPAPTL